MGVFLPQNISSSHLLLPGLGSLGCHRERLWRQLLELMPSWWWLPPWGMGSKGKSTWHPPSYPLKGCLRLDCFGKLLRTCSCELFLRTSSCELFYKAHHHLKLIWLLYVCLWMFWAIAFKGKLPNSRTSSVTFSILWIYLLEYSALSHLVTYGEPTQSHDFTLHPLSPNLQQLWHPILDHWREKVFDGLDLHPFLFSPCKIIQLLYPVAVSSAV